VFATETHWIIVV